MKHSDRVLEGAFLCWDLCMPTVWLWSFSLPVKKAVLLTAPKFLPHLYPFKTPSCLVNSKDLSKAYVLHMHTEDGDSMHEDKAAPDPDEALDAGEQGSVLGEQGSASGEQGRNEEESAVQQTGNRCSKHCTDKQDVDTGVGVLP